MKKIYSFILYCFFVIAIFYAVKVDHLYSEEIDIESIIKSLNITKEIQKMPLLNWKYNSSTDKRCLDPNFEPDKSWKIALPGTILPPTERNAWFWTKFKIPEKIRNTSIIGSKVILKANVVETGDIYINGHWKQNFRYLDGDALVTENALPNEEYIIVINVKNRNSGSVLVGAELEFSSSSILEQEIGAYLNDIVTIKSLLENHPEQEKIIKTLKKSISLIDFKARDSKNDDLFKISLQKARKELEVLKEYTLQYALYLIGYSHIDLAWLWDKREGEDVWLNTSRTILNLMNEYPQWIYCAGQAAGYQWMEKDYPEVFSEIKKRIEEGRWEVVGGTWVEFDSNLPGGESYVRQLLYGKRWFREKFNKDVVIAWTPDSFGYNWNLAQIYKKAGMIGFLTQKINWNDTTRFPYHIFWWEGPDGSKLLTYFPVGGYGESLDTGAMLNQLKTIKSNVGIDENFAIFGVGDHGGGVTRTHLNRAFAFKKSSLFPKTEFVSAEKYFKHLLELSKIKQFPTYKDELYLEYHRGTYTSQATTKQNNRKGEISLMNAETLSSIAKIYGYNYPRNEIRTAWDILMFNQFHDILPGSSINQVYKDADNDYAKMFELTSAVSKNALQTIVNNINTHGDGDALVLFNSLPWVRDEIVEIDSTQFKQPLENIRILDQNGKILVTQITETSEGKKKLIFVANHIPATGYVVYRIVAGKDKQSYFENSLKISQTYIENEFFKLTINSKNGNISSLIDKRYNKEYFGSGKEGNILQCFKDKHTEYDAWNIKLHEEIPVILSYGPEIVEHGPVKATLKIVKKIGNSTFIQYISLVKGIPQIFGRLEVDWKESHVMAKLAFQLNLSNDYAWYEIPYAAIQRAAIPKTETDKAKWEVSAQKWIDYTNSDNQFGISLLNNSKYGFDTKGNVVRMSLLRSPKDPDPEADMKHHIIEYALYPHVGTWQDAQTPRKGYEFNTPIITIMEENHDGILPNSKSFFSVEPKNVIISSIKIAEDSENETVIRIYESSGKDTITEINLPSMPKAVVETNLLEEDPINIPFENNKIKIPIGHYEIKTLKVTF